MTKKRIIMMHQLHKLTMLTRKPLPPIITTVAIDKNLSCFKRRNQNEAPLHVVTHMPTNVPVKRVRNGLNWIYMDHHRYEKICCVRYRVPPIIIIGGIGSDWPRLSLM